MTEPTVIVDIDHRGVATLTLNRPEVHNAFDDGLIDILTLKLKEIEDDTSVRVLVLAANGKSFSAGADLQWMRRMSGYSTDQNLQDARRLAGLMHTLQQLKKPTIARVQGAAIGGGVGLVACCDIAVAAEQAKFCLSEVRLGLIPAVISPYVVRAIGERHARRFMITAERFEAAEALRIGLVHEICAGEALDSKIELLLEQILANGPAAITATKSLVQRVAGGVIDDAMIEETAKRIAEIRASAQGKEGVSAFLEKRSPDWQKP